MSNKHRTNSGVRCVPALIAAICMTAILLRLDGINCTDLVLGLYSTMSAGVNRGVCPDL